MDIRKIYFDMDGVLADFNKGIKELCGIEPISQNGVSDKRKDDDMWERVRRVDHFYDKLDLMPGAKMMFDTLYDKHGDACEILSAIPKPHRGIETAGEDKTKWVKRLLSKDIVINIVYRADKQKYCTGKDCILIDDHEKNIAEWEAMGGTGILFTNVENVLQTIEGIHENS